MIEFKGVSKSFGETMALCGVDLTIPGDSVTVLIGPSGCGKSTLLRLIVGLVTPDSGAVTVNGIPVGPENLFRLRQGMGYVIQEGGLFPHLTAEKNVTLMGRYLGIDREYLRDRVETLAGLTRFPKDRLGCYPLQLSGGQRQRVSLMRALMLDPGILLFDEPLASLDPMIRSELQQDLMEIFRTLNKTVVWVTHDMREAGFFGDRIVLLRSGNIVQIGTLTELVRSPADPFVIRFVNAQRSPVDFSAESSS